MSALRTAALILLLIPLAPILLSGWIYAMIRHIIHGSTPRIPHHPRPPRRRRPSPRA